LFDERPRLLLFLLLGVDEFLDVAMPVELITRLLWAAVGSAIIWLAAGLRKSIFAALEAKA